MMKHLIIPLILCLACALTPADEENPEPTAQITPSETPAASAEKIQFFLIILEDKGASGTPVGCDDSIIGVNTDINRTGTLQTDLQSALEALFALNTEAYGESGFITSLADVDVTVENVTVNNDSAIINLSGEFMLSGVCADARMEAQILHTVFQFPELNSAAIYINGQNMQQLFDASGLAQENAIYTREDMQ